MLASFFRVAAVAAILALVSPLTAGAQQPGNAGQARIDQAIQAYASKLQADEERARDGLILGKTSALLDDPASPVLGNPKGDVAVIEFFDYTCPYCKAVEPRIEKLLKDDKGVRVILKEFPILTPESLVAAKAALASVKQGKYEPFHNALLAFRGRLQNEVIFDTAKSIGLDVDRLKKDMNAPEITDEIIANFNLARGLRIFQTPGFIVGGHFLTGESADIDFPKVAAAARAKQH
jgi:protein-disulfide isomerase